MKIAVIFTGGTIGSNGKSKYIKLFRENTSSLTDDYKKNYRSDIDFVPFTPYFIHSENLTFNELTQLTACVAEASVMDFDGIIITHGTDTLQFAAAAMSLIFADSKIPIVMVSSNYPLDDKRANGSHNFAAAVEFIVRGISAGVFVSYKNASELPQIHSASRLLAYDAFSDKLRSVRDEVYGCFANSCFIKNPRYSFRQSTELSAPSLKADFSAHNDILMLEQYVGLEYPALRDNTRAVILTSYHSGTICTCGDNFDGFCSSCSENGVPVFLVGMQKDAKQYESTEEFEKHGIVPLFNITPICAYMKLTLLLSETADDLAERMNIPVADEFFA